MAKYTVKVDGKKYDVTVTDSGAGARVTVDGATFDIEPATGAAPAAPTAPSPTVATPVAAAPAAAPQAVSATGAIGSIPAPIPGIVTQLLVKIGDSVAANQAVLKLEAMKMENDISTPIGGTVVEIPVREGSEVSNGQLLMVIG
jgi:glutaconyl-CoA decarboxylase